MGNDLFTIGPNSKYTLVGRLTDVNLSQLARELILDVIDFYVVYGILSRRNNQRNFFQMATFTKFHNFFRKI